MNSKLYADIVHGSTVPCTRGHVPNPGQRLGCSNEADAAGATGVFSRYQVVTQNQEGYLSGFMVQQDGSIALLCATTYIVASGEQMRFV
jgi:hypothetical protein